MKIIFSDHAKKQLAERKILRKSIVETVERPNKKIKSFKSRELRQKRFGDKVLEVVIIQEEDSVTIITQYWLEKEYN